MANLLKDVVLDANMPTEFLLNKHIKFVLAYGSDKNEFEFCTTEYLRMSGMYWILTTLAVTKKLDQVDKKQFMEFILECIDEKTGGIGACVNHDPHILYTLSAVQIACILDAVDELPVDKIVSYISSLQKEDGSFMGDKWGEIDTRFSFCAVACLSLLGRLDVINVDKAVDFVLSCQNFDGGFGSHPNAESHAGLIYCCVGVLSITHSLSRIDSDLLGWWLCERQLPSGGLNGRPEKLPDVCYSWWVLSSLTMLGRLHWIDKQQLKQYILASQDTDGGFSDRPGDMPDPFHTLFGIAALSLLEEPDLAQINPAYCMPQYIIDKLNLSPQILQSQT